MPGKKLIQCAEALRKAEIERRGIPPLTETYPGLTVSEAYDVQLLNVKAAQRVGRVVIGKKIGLTSEAMQASLGVSEPDFGHLFDDMVFNEEKPISVSRFIQPKIEAEIAFVMGADLNGPGVTAQDVLRTAAGVVPAFELIDSRIADWRITLPDTVADNGSNGGLVLGAGLIEPNAVNLKYVGLVLEKNGRIINTAAGAVVMGHPAQAVAWLANALGSKGLGLKKGEIILSGSFTMSYEARPGDIFTATFGGLGSVKAVFKD